MDERKDQELYELMVKQTEAMLAGVEEQLPPATDAFGSSRELMLEMSDGAKLKTELFFPQGDGPWPVILMRNPYLAVKPLIHKMAHIFSQYGFATVYQQNRGTLESEGEWVPFANERRDGLDTVHWIVKQSWMNGKVGTFGGSYGGFMQWCMADSLPPEVKTMYIQNCGGDPYDMYYTNGMFKFGLGASWVTGAGINNYVDPLEKLMQALQIKPHIELDKQLFGREISWYRDVVSSQERDDELWTQGFWADIRDIAEKVDIPVLFQGGWFDFFLDSQIRTFNRLKPSTKQASRYILTPWHHGNLPGGDLTFPNDLKFGTMLIKDALEWFEHHLKGAPYPHRKGVVEAYVIGEGTWRTWENEIQPSDIKALYLNVSREQSYKGGTLELAASDRASDHAEAIKYVYDPANPVPTNGGTVENPLHPSVPAKKPPNCSVLQEEPGFRPDVITFLSEPMEEGWRIAGSIKVHLTVSSSAEDTSFTAKVIEVRADGSAYNIQDGITTLRYRDGSEKLLDYHPGEQVEVELALTPIVWKLQPGSRLRLDISSSNYPAYHAHSNLKGIWSFQSEMKIAEQTLHIGGAHRSYVEIPISS